MTKVFTLLQRKEGWSRSRFSQYWSSTHKEHALDLAHAGFFTGYVQNHLISDLPALTCTAADGIPEIWIASPQSLTDLAASEVYQQGAAKDEPNFTSGEISSYISAGGPERALTVLSSPSHSIRHLVFLQLMTQTSLERAVGALEQCVQGQAADIYSTTSASDEHGRCIVYSGFWNEVLEAKNSLSAMAATLTALPDVRLLSAGVYESRTIVSPLINCQ